MYPTTKAGQAITPITETAREHVCDTESLQMNNPPPGPTSPTHGKEVSWHRCACPRTDGHQQWVGFIAKDAARALLDQRKRFFHLDQGWR